MNIEKYTERARGFVQSAQSLAMRDGHQQFSSLHMLKVLLDDSEGLAGGLIDRAGGNSRAILKATEGQTFDDPNYAGYRTGANGAGVYIGAYHFARPDSTPDDATLEADHFTTVAAPRSGDIVPVLDMEDSGGLSTTTLITWAQTWLDRVSTTVGTRPMIYTGPSFWRTYMGDTTQFADEGYRLLWIANWGVPEPDVPAQNWGGNGWTFWQWTNCGSVPGISGCVDLDYLKASRRRFVRIP